jgi:hypothetical protein
VISLQKVLVGTSPINWLGSAAMNEIGYDISGNSIDSVFNFFKEGRTLQYDHQGV